MERCGLSLRVPVLIDFFDRAIWPGCVGDAKTEGATLSMGYAFYPNDPAWASKYISMEIQPIGIDEWVASVEGRDERSSVEESFAAGLLDWPHYTRPEVYAGLTVPQVLLSGNHADIRRWRLGQAVARTWQRRPDLIAAHTLAPEASRLLNEFLTARAVGRD